MTTKVTVDAHAGWDVQVEVINVSAQGEVTSIEVVSKHTTKDFYIHSGMRLGEVKELVNS